MGLILAGLVPFVPTRVQSWLLAGTGLLLGSVSIYALVLPQPYRSIHSLFLLVPYAIFAVLMIRLAYRQKSFQVTLLTITTLLYLVFGTIMLVIKLAHRDIEAGGLEWGQRYLLTIYPLLAICAVAGIYHFYQTISANRIRYLLLGIGFILLLVSMQYQLRGINEIRTTKEILVAQATILENISQPIVTDLWWLPNALASRFVEQEIYTLAQREDLYRWLNLTAGRVNTFVFVTFVPLDDEFISAAPYPIRLTQEQIVNNMFFSEFEVLPATASP
jgi:hypothetical protein